MSSSVIFSPMEGDSTCWHVRGANWQSIIRAQQDEDPIEIATRALENLGRGETWRGSRTGLIITVMGGGDTNLVLSSLVLANAGMHQEARACMDSEE